MQLYEHQKKVLKETKQFNRVGYFLDMGLGKTFVGSEKAVQLGKHILVVCQKSKVQDWVNHFIYNQLSNCFICDLTIKEGYNDFIHLVQYAPKQRMVGIINYELVFRKQELLNLSNFTLLLDESSMITNPTAKRTKFIQKLRAENCILLSGTPTGGKYEKLWSQLQLLGWKISRKEFYERYIITKKINVGNGMYIDIVQGYKNIGELKEKLKEYGCVFLKTDEVLTLPEMVFIEKQIENSKVYIEFMKKDYIKLDDIELIGDTSLKKLLYARQLCSTYSKEKLVSFKDLIESTEDRVIVFYNFTSELEVMQKVIDRPISIVNGAIKDLANYEEKENSITFIQYQAGAMGLNLQKANKIIYFSLPLQSDLFEQSKKRIHRIGQNLSCFYYLLVVKNTVEEDIYKTLKARKNYDDKLFLKEIENAI